MVLDYQAKKLARLAWRRLSSFCLAFRDRSVRRVSRYLQQQQKTSLPFSHTHRVCKFSRTLLRRKMRPKEVTMTRAQQTVSLGLLVTSVSCQSLLIPFAGCRTMLTYTEQRSTSLSFSSSFPLARRYKMTYYPSYGPLLEKLLIDGG